MPRSYQSGRPPGMINLKTRKCRYSGMLQIPDNAHRTSAKPQTFKRFGGVENASRTLRKPQTFKEFADPLKGISRLRTGIKASIDLAST